MAAKWQKLDRVLSILCCQSQNLPLGQRFLFRQLGPAQFQTRLLRVLIASLIHAFILHPLYLCPYLTLYLHILLVMTSHPFLYLHKRSTIFLFVSLSFFSHLFFLSFLNINYFTSDILNLFYFL